MIRLKVTKPMLSTEYGMGDKISFLLDLGHRKRAEALLDQLGGKEICLVVSEYKEKRSLSQNAYFHHLVGQIAETLGIGEDEVKEDLVLDYGAQLYSDDGQPVGLKIPKGIDPKGLGIKYPKWVRNVTENGIEFSIWIVY